MNTLQARLECLKQNMDEENAQNKRDMAAALIPLQWQLRKSVYILLFAVACY
jgi:hypothetical protein